MHNLGQTRSSHQHNHLLLTADTFVRTTLPGMRKCVAIVHVGPALGTRFTEYTAEFEAGGELGSTAAQRFVFIIEGSVKVVAAGKDDPDLQVRCLLPDEMSFDFAVNTMVYQPGAALSMVEMHVMEHGLMMLEGGGIYRLDNSWYSVTAGDFIWMGPWCPQWFGAIGKVPAKYLIYKDWNRHPLAGAQR